jgi:MFS family permease
MELFWRTWFAAFSVIVSVGLMLVTLVTLEFKRDYERLLGERMLVIGASAAAPFSAAAELGLPMNSVRNASALLDIPRQTDPLISGVWVLDAQYQVIHGAGSWIMDENDVKTILKASDGQANGWYITFNSSFVAGTPIRNSNAEQVGQVIITYPLEVSRTRVLAMAAELLFQVLLISVVASLATGLLLRVWIAREIGNFSAVMANLTEFERQVWTMQPGDEKIGKADHIRGMLGQSRAVYCGLIEKPPEHKDVDRGKAQKMMPSSFTINREGLRLRLVAILTFVVIMSVVAMSLVVVVTFNTAIAPELENRTRLIGATVRGDLQRVLQMGIPLDAAGGLEGFLENAVAPFPEVRRVAILTSNGNVVAEVIREDLATTDEGGGLFSLIGVGPTEFSLPIIVGNRLVGQVEVEGSPQFVRIRLRDIFLDVGALSFLVILVGVEVAILAAAVGIWKPYGRLIRLLREQSKGQFIAVARVSGPGQLSRAIARLNDQVQDLARRRIHTGADRPRRLQLSDVVDMRLVLLIYVIGAEITASFLPLYGASATRVGWMSADVAAALPVASFLVGVAALSPFAGGLTRRFGPRRLFVASSVLTALALAGMALADSIATIAAARGIVAVFYALATISCLQYALEAQSEARGLQEIAGGSASASYYAMIFGGLVGGSALGGVVSSLFSYESAIFLGAVLVLASAAIALVFMDGAAGRLKPPATKSALPTRLTGAVRLRLAILIGIIGAPVAATTAILVWYLTPLFLSGAGHSTSEIGRVVMLYYLMLVAVGPAANALFGRRQNATLSLVAGTMLAAAVLFFHDLSTGILGYSFALAGLGIGHALIRTPLLTAVIETSGTATGPVNILRGVDRLGGLVGLAAGSVLLYWERVDLALSALAWLSLAGAVLLCLHHAISGARRDCERRTE